jgi:general secretion pathway protein M
MKKSSPLSTRSAQQPSAIGAFWSKLAPREQLALRWAAAAMILAGLWWTVGAPAWTTWKQAPGQHRQLDMQWQQVQTLAVQARALQAQALLSRDDRLRALESTTQRLLGQTAKLQVSADQATVTLQRTPADGLTNWLAEVRANARLTPAETRLNRDSTATSTPIASSRSGASTPAAVTWSGTLLLPL